MGLKRESKGKMKERENEREWAQEERGVEECTKSTPYSKSMLQEEDLKM